MIKPLKLIIEPLDFRQNIRPKQMLLREVFETVTAFYFKVVVKKGTGNLRGEKKIVLFCLKILPKLSCK